jgi:hypothetical protein
MPRTPKSSKGMRGGGGRRRGKGPKKTAAQKAEIEMRRLKKSAIETRVRRQNIDNARRYEKKLMNEAQIKEEVKYPTPKGVGF